ncbi:MAG: class I SAM-dependent methyltransferase [Pseudomonadota bacterium]
MSQTIHPPELPFSGERFTPECVREMAYEHWHRYALASTLVDERRVLDAACGEGYGSALLATRAISVDGVDLSAEAVDHARRRYHAENLRFHSASVTDLPADDSCYDAVISFETLEHLSQQAEMLQEFRRVLRDTGFLMISSPDKATYSDATGYNNEFHVKELYRDELLTLLKSQFPAVRLLGQAMAFQSLIWPVDGTPGADPAGCQSLVMHEDRLEAAAVPPGQPLYFIAVCAAREADLPALPGLSQFGDAEQSVYAHYQHEIRKNMAAGKLLAERDQEIERLRQALQEAKKGHPDHGV